MDRAKEGPWERSVRTVYCHRRAQGRAGVGQAGGHHLDVEEPLVGRVGHRLEQQDWTSGQRGPGSDIHAGVGGPAWSVGGVEGRQEPCGSVGGGKDRMEASLGNGGRGAEPRSPSSRPRLQHHGYGRGPWCPAAGPPPCAGLVACTVTSNPCASGPSAMRTALVLLPRSGTEHLMLFPFSSLCFADVAFFTNGSKASTSKKMAARCIAGPGPKHR